MKFHIPFTFSDLEKLKRKSKIFLPNIKPKKKTRLGEYLKNSDINLTREEYLSICLRTFIFSFILFAVISTIVLAILAVSFFYIFALGIALMFSLFIFFSQNVYPRIYITRRQRDIEKNLIPALEDVLIQINSGIPLFSVLINISASNYGELSIEFKKAVKRINSGEPQADVLDDLGKKNPSVFFRRTLWQISSGMKSGSDMTIVIQDSIKALHSEQVIQIQNYGNKLNPLVVFYLLIAIIIPALSISFLTILSSMLSVPRNQTLMLFLGLFIFVFLIQIMFIGVIKSRRPSLL
jgi:flagellar protein FlaJ